MTAMHRQPIVGVFRDYEQAAQAVEELQRLGFRENDLSIASGTERDASAGGMTVSELLSGLMSLDVPEQEARRYAEEFQAGRTVVTVQADDRHEEAADVLRRYGATSEPPRSSEESERMELREEQIVVDKEMREAGEVRVRKHVEEAPSEVPVDVVREHVEVERVPMDEVVTERRQPWSEDDVLVVPVYEERPVVRTELVLREQLRVRLVSATEPQVVEGTVRRERATVEEIDDSGNVRGREPVEPEARAQAPAAAEQDNDPGGAGETSPPR